MASSSSLCPGYKQVEAFGPDDEYEDEEVAYVTLDLGSIEPTLVPSSSTYRLIGLDTPTPFLQLSGTILKGRHESLLGTELIFTDGKDPHDTSKKALTHVANTEQRICFREVRLVPKGSLPLPGTSSKGKNKETPAPLDGWVVEAEAAAHMVDRVTGKNAPRARGPRRSGTGTGVGGEGEGSTRTTRTTRAKPKPKKESGKGKGKGKGKEKAREEEEEEGEEGEGMQVDIDEDDEDDEMDVYVP